MIGARALRTCSVCRDKLRAATISRAPALARSIVGTSARYHVESSRIGIDDSVFGFSSSTTTTNRISNLSVGNEQTTPEEDEDWAPREERRSPAAVFGSKRVGLETIPRRMDENIQSEINNHHPREIREAFLSSLEPTKSKSRGKKYDDKGPSLALAKAATALPGDYAVMSNVLREVRGRLGEGWLKGKQGDVMEISSGYGPGLWALREGGDVEKGMRLIHTNRHGLELSKRLFENRTVDSEVLDELDPEVSVAPEAEGKMSYERKFTRSPTGMTALVISSFYLSTLPTVSSRQVHLRQLLSSSAPYIILVDRASPEGWQAISEARSYILSLADDPSADAWHLIAPCPHEYDCPLAGGRDRCSFSQKLQRPSFTRKTKHANRGEEDVNYTYLVIGKGPRPAKKQGMALDSLVSDIGRLGGVGKEALEKEAIKREGKSELKEVEGGEFEMVSMSELPTASSDVEGQTGEEIELGLRGEAYTWPRVVAPPMKRAGHVILDTCFPDGNIQRLTYAKSHSKQVYYDARKSAWGDLFPHGPKIKIVRKRGVRKLVKEEGFAGLGDESGLEEILASAEEEDLELSGMPVAELESGEGDAVITWKSGRVSRGGSQARGFSTSSRRPTTPSFHTTPSHRHMSARPESQPNHVAGPRPKVTLNTLRSLAAAKTPITCLTAYDFPTALLSESAGIEMVLVGDSLSQVALGHSSTTSITLDEMIHHAKAVTRGAKSPFVFADMPFGSFEASLEVGVGNVVRMIKEAGVDGVKIEGGREIVPLVRRLSAIGVPVIPHIGLQPQRATILSGYLVQGKTASSAMDLFETAKELHEAGAIGFLLEAIPHKLATYISNELGTLTIGIGAGSGTHAQVLVITDVLGLYDGEGTTRPRFVRGFGKVGEAMREAVEGYRDEVRSGSFPETGKETYTMKKEEWEGFLQARKEKGE